MTIVFMDAYLFDCIDSGMFVCILVARSLGKYCIVG
jgi:hypothetical protein